MQANNGEINYNVETVYVKEEYNIKEEKVRLTSLPINFFFPEIPFSKISCSVHEIYKSFTLDCSRGLVCFCPTCYRVIFLLKFL